MCAYCVTKGCCYCHHSHFIDTKRMVLSGLFKFTQLIRGRGRVEPRSVWPQGSFSQKLGLGIDLNPPFCQLLTLLKPLSSSLSPPTSSSSKPPFWGGGALHSCAGSSSSIINLVLVYLGIGSTSHGSKFKILTRVISPFPLSSPDYPSSQTTAGTSFLCLCSAHIACVYRQMHVYIFSFFFISHITLHKLFCTLLFHL